MSDRARRKEKQRLKRKQKQLALRKAKSASPIRQIAHLADSLDCWINGNWKEQGMVNLLVFGETPGGHGAMAAFLIDIWCVGLKDAWGRHEISRVEFRTETVDRAAEAMPMRRIGVEEARGLLAGAIRFSQQNKFRLPRHHDRWTAIFGGLDDVASADLRHFGKDGGLLFTGDINFLRQRYTGGTAEEFLNREDVHWVMPPDEINALYALDEDDEDEEYDDEESGDEEWDEQEDMPGPAEVEEAVDSFVSRLTFSIQNRCLGQGQVPHPKLEDAVVLMMSAVALALAKNPQEIDRKLAFEFVGRFLETQDEKAQAEIELALAQVTSYIEQRGFQDDFMNGEATEVSEDELTAHARLVANTIPPNPK